MAAAQNGHPPPPVSWLGTSVSETIQIVFVPGSAPAVGVGSLLSPESNKSRVHGCYATTRQISYCGHITVIGKTERNWQDTGYVLQLLGKKVS
jgi:hypothetical protein